MVFSALNQRKAHSRHSALASIGKETKAEKKKKSSSILIEDRELLHHYPLGNHGIFNNSPDLDKGKFKVWFLENEVGLLNLEVPYGNLNIILIKELLYHELCKEIIAMSTLLANDL